MRPSSPRRVAGKRLPPAAVGAAQGWPTCSTRFACTVARRSSKTKYVRAGEALWYRHAIHVGADRGRRADRVSWRAWHPAPAGRGAQSCHARRSASRWRRRRYGWPRRRNRRRWRAEERLGPGSGGGLARARTASEAWATSATRIRTPSRSREKRVIRNVGEKTFVFDGQRWVDTAWEGKQEPKKITAFSDEYFKLVEQHKELARFFALGERVLVVFDGDVYETVPASNPDEDE